MLAAESLALYVASALVLLVVPGPAVTYVAARSLDQGAAAGMLSSLGLCAGLLVHVAATVSGLSAALSRWPASIEALRLAGGAYLLWLGATSLRRRAPRPAAVGGDGAGPSRRRLFWDGFVIDALNPKPALFFLAFLPQFADPRSATPLPVQLLGLGLVYVLLAALTTSAYAGLFGRLRGPLVRSTRLRGLERWLTAGCLVALGLAALAGGAG